MSYLKLKKFINDILQDETKGAILVIALVSIFCLFTIFFGFNWPTYLIAMVCGFLISLKNPKAGLFSIIFLTIVFEKFFTLESIPFSGSEIKLYPLDIIFGASFLGMLFNYAFSKEKIKIAFPEKALLIFMLLNVLYFPLSYFQHADLALSFSTLKYYVFYSLFYFLVFGLIKNKVDLWKLCKFFFAGAVTAIIFFVIGLARQKGLWTEFNPLSTDGVRLLAFSHGLFMSVALIPTFLYIVFSEKKNKLWLNIILILWVGGIFGTLMRHLWISLFASFVIIFLITTWESKKAIFKYALKLLLPVILMVAFVSFYPTIIAKLQKPATSISDAGLGMVAERTQSITAGSADDSFYWRSIAWKSGLNRFKENPIFGIGTGQRVVVEMKWLTQNVEVRSIHNSYLSTMIQFGLLGLLIFLTFIFSLLKKLYAFRHDFSAVMVGSVLLFFLVASFFQPYLETNFLALFFWISLGLAKAIPEMEQTNS